MYPDNVPQDHKTDQPKSDYMPGQYPGYLSPDGTWRFGVNAKKIASASWAINTGRALKRISMTKMNLVNPNQPLDGGNAKNIMTAVYSGLAIAAFFFIGVMLFAFNGNPSVTGIN